MKPHLVKQRQKETRLRFYEDMATSNHGIWIGILHFEH